MQLIAKNFGAHLMSEVRIALREEGLNLLVHK